MELYSDKTFYLLKKGIHRIDMYPGWGPGMRNCFVIHYVISGTGYFEVNGKKYKLHAGDSFLITPFTTVHYYPDAEDRWLYAWIDFAGNKAAELMAEMNWNMANPVCTIPLSDKLMPLYTQLHNLDIYNGNCYNEANGLMSAILGIYADAMSQSKRTSKSSSHQRLAAAALNLIHTNYHHADFHIDSMYSMLNLSHATLYRLFIDEMGVSPQTYLQHYRIEQAKKMILNGASVKNTALSCGYENALYFSKVFKRNVGVTPSEYKE